MFTPAVDYLSKKCSIVSIHDHIVVIDHRNDDCVIEPACGQDALAHYSFLKSSNRYGGVAAAQDFLVKIADGQTPVTDMIHLANSKLD